MLEKWKCTPDFRLLLRRIFKECVEFDIRLVVEWVPSKENQFSDALRRKEMQLFFDLHKKWKAESLWRKDRDDWKLFAEETDLFSAPDVGGAGRKFYAPTEWPVVVYRVPPWTEAEWGADQEMRELEDGVAYFGLNAKARNTRSSYGTGVKDLHLELGYPLPEFGELHRLRRTLRGIKRVKGNPKHKKLGIGLKESLRIFSQGKVDLSQVNDLASWTGCLLAFGGCFRKANITAKKQACFAQFGVMLRGGVKFLAGNKMEVTAGFSKTNQFAEREHKVLFQSVLFYTKAGDAAGCPHSLVFDHWLKDKLRAAGMHPEQYSGHSFRRGAATLAFAEKMPRNLVKHWGDWVPDAVDEYHKMSQEQCLAIPKLVADSMEAAVDAFCRQDCAKQDWAGHNAWCNPPFSRILKILLHFLACKRRQNVGTSACFVIPVWPTADFYKFIVARPGCSLLLETDLFSAPDVGGAGRKFYAPTEWPVVVYRVPPWTEAEWGADQEMRELENGVAYFGLNAKARNTRSSYGTGVKDLHLELGYPLPEFGELHRLRRTLRGIKRVKGNPKHKKLGIGLKESLRIFSQGKVDLSQVNDLASWTGCLLAFGGCFRKANITAKKQACFAQFGVMLRGGVKFLAGNKMEVTAGFSKTNQFAEREHKVLFQSVLFYTKAGDAAGCPHSLVFDHWLKDKLRAAGMHPEQYSGHSYRRGAATLAFAEKMPRNLVKHWGDWVPDAVDEYHEMSQEQCLAIPKLVADSMEAAVDAFC
ncbi:hypothetical protein CYMTET_48502 [Cymbomonas tetramitiformis]|uniref:Tyr recombinase domain-containing protein n=1 Tax=Cymbomonas tetramitiformis TaxID=36881 RepID=A0AAE0BS63_9CHLO|nr:hypothetical protein CYMTET_48502 [Cymbomonas tetramitiformis]